SIMVENRSGPRRSSSKSTVQGLEPVVKVSAER
ncbi:hypothetical protein A2U01_0118910, partial [Trifolium medium]|nr:hypothetical protein [Trifolium medium]